MAMIRSMILALTLVAIMGVSSTYAEEEEAAEEKSTLKTRVVNGVTFLIEDDREVHTDPNTGLLIPEPMDRYMTRKYNALKEEKDKDIENLEERLAQSEENLKSLQERFDALETALQTPILGRQLKKTAEEPKKP